MRNIIYIVIAVLLLTGCATMQQMEQERNKYVEQAMIDKGRYFANPTNKLMIEIETLGPNWYDRMQCNFSSGSLSNMNSNNWSREIETPFVSVLDMDEPIKKIKASYNTTPQPGKEILKLWSISQMPFFTLVCQSQYSHGLDGKIYFNGKEVSSDVTSLEYGVITLSYTLSIEDMLEEK
jgi:hypothetical protein